MNNAISDQKLDILLNMEADVIEEACAKAFLESDLEPLTIPKPLKRKILLAEHCAHLQIEFGTILKTHRHIIAAIMIFCALSFAIAISIDAI